MTEWMEKFLDDGNHLIQLFKQVCTRIQNDNYIVVIKPEKLPVEENTRRFNAPKINELSILMIGYQLANQDITLCGEKIQFKRIKILIIHMTLYKIYILSTKEWIDIILISTNEIHHHVKILIKN